MKNLILLCMMGWMNCFAGTAYTLPDPAFIVNPNWSNTTTIVTFAGVSYRGPSAYTYVGECAQPDGPRYHCNIMHEDNVALFSNTGTRIAVTITMQDAAVLITSGHNYWRNTDTVQSGTVVLP